MKGKTKSIISVLLAALIITCTSAGCTDRENIPSASGTGDAVGITETLPSKDGAGNTADMTGTGECPEGYVYDYQVSMEPIPEEIATLGGPCEGTIHAFPSRIGMALTELEMEKDPVLKAEVEKRIPEIEAALEEEIGGEFVVDGVILINQYDWCFFCTEVDTGYQFDMVYYNNEYLAQEDNNIVISNRIFVEDYYDEKKSIEIRNDLIPIISEIYSIGNMTIRVQSEVNVIDIIIAQYTENTVDKVLEQEKVLNLWDSLQNYDREFYYRVNLIFYPLEYQNVIEEKYCSVFRYDVTEGFSEEIMNCLAENENIWCCLIYSGFSNKYDEENLDVLLQQYKDGKYDKATIWKYWIQ